MRENAIVRLPARWPVVCIALLLGACAGIPQRDDAPSPRDRYLAYAGEPVGSFSFFGRFDGWCPVGRDQLVVWTRPSNAYLLTVISPCLDLESATHIGFSARVNELQAKLDPHLALGALRRIEGSALEHCGINASGFADVR